VPGALVLDGGVGGGTKSCGGGARLLLMVAVLPLTRVSNITITATTTTTNYTSCYVRCAGALCAGTWRRYRRLSGTPRSKWALIQLEVYS